MKAMVTYKSHSRGEKGDSLKFIDDATGQLPPTIELHGGEKDGERMTPKALRYGKESGRITIVAGGHDIFEAVGELQRTDAWEVDEETGEIEASASMTFTFNGRVTGDEIKALTTAEGLAITFKPAQAKLEFKKATGKTPDEFVKKVGEELEKNFGPGEMIDGTLTFDVKNKRKKKDAA